MHKYIQNILEYITPTDECIYYFISAAQWGHENSIYWALNSSIINNL